MSEQNGSGDPLFPVSRRDLIRGGVGLAALGAVAGTTACGNNTGARPAAPQAPFDSMRDYIAALDARNLVMRIPRVDQDAYEAAALMYRIRDHHGMRGAPTLIFDEVRIDGEWIKGPLLVNESGNMHSECLVFGLEPVPQGLADREPFASYRKARAHVERMVADNGGEYPQIPPVEVAASEAPCKEVVLTGDDIDLTRFAFIKGNPSDAGRYINTGTVYTRHPKYGINFGTYRCHLRGPREMGLNSEPGQTGYRHLTAARDRGEKIAKVTMVLTPDPYVWMVSGNKFANRSLGPVDELAIAGGLAGRPLKVVRSETNDFMIPANAEMVIEGEVPLDDMRPEGPYGEMVGYQGRRKDRQFWLHVTSVTHRRDPWLMNNFTGQQAGTLMAAGHARAFLKLKEQIPSVVDYLADNRCVGVTFVSIRKTRPGEGLEVAQQITESNYFSKVVVVVDDDLDVANHEQMLAALGARWQPDGNAKIYEAMPALPLDPSTVRRGRTSKIAIDATRQWPEEGGPGTFPSLNRTLLEEGAPDSFASVDEKWGQNIRDWKPA